MLIRFFLSTDRYISNSDIQIGAANWNMPSGSMVTARAQITIPLNIPLGIYYVGYRADPTDEIAELDETNNFVSLSGPLTIR